MNGKHLTISLSSELTPPKRWNLRHIATEVYSRKVQQSVEYEMGTFVLKFVAVQLILAV